MHEIELWRTNHLVDPTLSIWGWEVAVYLFLGGLVAGLMVLVPLIGGRTSTSVRSRALRLAPLLAPALLSVGMLALLLDLEQRWHIWRFYTTFNPFSPMSWGSWLLLVVYPVTVLYGLAQVVRSEIAALGASKLAQVIARLASWSMARERQLAQLMVIFGIGLGAYTGILLGTLGARAVWGSLLLAPLFLASGISTGAALLLLLPLTHDEHALVRRWDIGVIVIEVALLGLFFVDLVTTGGTAGRSAAALFWGGDLTARFVSIVLVAGLAIPLTLEVLEGRRHLAASFATPALILMGGLALRWLLVSAGQM